MKVGHRQAFYSYPQAKTLGVFYFCINTRDSIILIKLFDSLPSTNDYLLSQAIQEPIACRALTQTAGKGRLGRTWYSPLAGENLYFSLYWPFKRLVHELSGLSLAVGVGVLEGLSSLQPLPEGVNIKWPNDLEHNEAKFAGILIEIHRNQGVVIGVGLNMTLPVKSIDGRLVTDLSHIWRTRPTTDKVFEACLTTLTKKTLPQFDAEGFTPFHVKWSKYKKKGQDINDKGELIAV